MGVYCEVQICVVLAAPLPIEQRVGIVDLAIAHELITKHAEVRIEKTLPPRGVLGHLKHLFGHRVRYFGALEAGPPGPWIAERMRALPASSDFQVTSGFPHWNGEELTGPFVYFATQQARSVRTVNLYRAPEKRSPHEAPDGVIGSFYDTLSITAKRGLNDARGVARSAFVRELKKLTGAKVTCRASWV